MPIILNFIHFFGFIDTKYSKSFRKFCRRLYNAVIFPFSIGFMFEGVALSRSSEKQLYNYLDLFLNLSLKMLLSFVFCFEWKSCFYERTRSSFYVLKDASQKYITVYLAFYLSIIIILCCANQGILRQYQEMSFVLTLLYAIWFFLQLPYNDNIHNIGQIVNILLLLLFIGWSILRFYDQSVSK